MTAGRASKSKPLRPSTPVAKTLRCPAADVREPVAHRRPRGGFLMSACKVGIDTRYRLVSRWTTKSKQDACGTDDDSRHSTTRAYKPDAISEPAYAAFSHAHNRCAKPVCHLFR